MAKPVDINAIQIKTWLSDKEAEAYTGLNRHVLRDYRNNGTPKGTLPFCRVGRFIRYKRTDIDHFLEQHSVQSA